MRDGSDRGGRGDNIVMMQHDSRLVGGGRSGKGSQMSSVGSDIDHPTFHDPHGPDTISNRRTSSLMGIAGGILLGVGPISYVRLWLILLRGYGSHDWGEGMFSLIEINVDY